MVTDPFRGLIDGVLQGHAIATQLRHQALQEEAFQRAKAREDRQAQIHDIEIREMLGRNARPVMAGTVTDQFQAPGVQTVPGLGTPEAQTVSIARPADKARTVRYKDQNGEAQEYELLTPEEQVKREVARATEVSRANSTRMTTTDPKLLEAGAPAEYWVPNSQIRQTIDSIVQNQPVPTTPDYQKATGQPSVPRRLFPGVVQFTTAAQNRAAAETRANTAEAGRNQRNADSIASREKTAAAANATREKLKAMGGKAKTNELTANQVATRKQADEKIVRDLNQKIADLHKQKIDVGTTMVQSKTEKEDEFKERRQKRLGGLDLKIQTLEGERNKVVKKYEPAPAPAQGVQPAAGTVPHRNAAGQTVVFDGKAWVDQANGKPVQ